MWELIIVISLVVIAAVYLFKKLQNAFTKPQTGCSNCSCGGECPSKHKDHI